uniref:TATA box-binding protein-associated factor RNA polymerase I subunit D n=1 Tax=Anolis carolinensis TaxID=28377 RepID=G1KQ11_ANOCA|nr:PREDICTED: TATA box-binding protein-associated factor RNA polymerase I subunit D [Anolis carolinensis]|eukprot:XP_008106300.2 PREDICTED: TATA box-binding protein-associated factor RNA polymerase I subunit D [Anolis carolinensis]
MADISETEDSAAHHQDSKKTNVGSCLLKQAKKKGKTLSSAKCGPSSASAPAIIKSNGSVKPGGQVKLPMPKIDLKAFFDYYFVRKQHKKLKRRIRKRPPRKKTPEGQKPKIPVRQGQRRLRISVLERKKRAKERGLQFPFVEKLCGRKHIPLKLVCRYEQEAIQGYFRYIETLKYEQHLKKSLAKLNAGDDLENESLESRKYKYLDDDGPLSPIEEPIEEDQNINSGNDDIGARIVEKSSFILSSTIPEEKKKYKKKFRSCKNE